MPRGTFTAGGSLPVSDTLLAGSTKITISSLTSGRTFNCGGIFVGSSSDEDELADGYATVVGTLVGETNEQSWPINIRTPVPIAFKSINPTGTTARGIKLLSEI